MVFIGFMGHEKIPGGSYFQLRSSILGRFRDPGGGRSKNPHLVTRIFSRKFQYFGTNWYFMIPHRCIKTIFHNDFARRTRPYRFYPPKVWFWSDFYENRWKIDVFVKHENKDFPSIFIKVATEPYFGGVKPIWAGAPCKIIMKDGLDAPMRYHKIPVGAKTPKFPRKNPSYEVREIFGAHGAHGPMGPMEPRGPWGPGGGPWGPRAPPGPRAPLGPQGPRGDEFGCKYCVLGPVFQTPPAPAGYQKWIPWAPWGPWAHGAMGPMGPWE